MKVYFCRHGVAEETHADGDAARALTAAGVSKMRQVARGMARIVGKKGVGRILTSPLVRARQTAEIMAKAFDRPDVKLCPPLGTGGPGAKLLKAIRAEGEVPGILVVGHEPWLSEWIGELCFGRKGSLCLKKGGIAEVELMRGRSRGELVWLMQPGELRDLGR